MPKDDIGGGKIIGKVAYIDADDLYVLGDHVYALRLTEGFPKYFSYLINRYETNSSLKSKVGGSAQLGLSRKAVEEQEVSYSDLRRTTCHRLHPLRHRCRDCRVGAASGQNPRHQAGYDAAAPSRDGCGCLNQDLQDYRIIGIRWVSQAQPNLRFYW